MATGLRFKGTLAVLVDPLLLEARLALSREGDLEYDDGAVVRVLSDAGVTEGFDIDAIVDAIQAFQRSKAAETEIPAANGEPAVPPTGEVWEWEELAPLADEMRTVAAGVFRQAGPPEVFQVRVEKVKVQKKVAGKAGLFGAAQDQIETVIENREIRQKVLVDPNPVKVFFVEEGTKVATVFPARPGQPGRDLGGRPIPAPTARVASFLGGANLTRSRAEVVAATMGFVRVGRNWADLVSFRDHSWSVSYSADKTSAFLDFQPGGEEAGPPIAKPILDRLGLDGFDAARMPAEAVVQGIIDDAFRTSTALVARSLVTDRDGVFEIKFNSDRSKATLDLHKPLGSGTPLSFKDLGAALRDAQLKGFSFDTVKGVIQEFLNGPNTELGDLPLAAGRSPTKGKDLVLAYSVGFLPDADLVAIRTSLNSNPRLLETLPDKAKLPPEKVEKAGPVREGQEFARLESPAEGAGEDGIDVKGNKIPAVLGNDPPLVLLSNVRRNGNQLEAAIDGLLELGTIDGATVLRVRPHFDAMAAVHRSDDNMTAWLTLAQGRGTGRRLDRGLIETALEAAQVQAGIDNKAIDEALTAAQAGGKVEHVVVAQGIPSANDLERRLTFAQPARVDSAGRRRSSIHEGEIAATYRPPSEGQIDGTDVLGNLIPSQDMEVRSLVVSSDFEVQTDESGNHVLKALKGGELLFDGESVSVVAQIVVPAVGGKAGNVKFPGEVTVTGAIETGAYVVAGNLKVRGRVGGALLSSDNNIQVADGIHGEGKAVLRAKKHISVGFVERALVMAVGDVHVGKSALACTFRVNGKIVQKTTGGGLQGGLTKVRLGLDVMNLGSPSKLATVISFGQDYLVEDQIQAEVKETDKLREAIVQLDVLMRKLAGPADREKLASARGKKVLMMKLLDKRNLKLINLRDKFDLHVPSEIVIRETIFPGVSIESHGRVYEPGSRKSAIRLVFNEQTGHIEEKPLD